MIDPSPAFDLLHAAAACGLDVDALLARSDLSTSELATLAFDFHAFWARSKQRITPGKWRSWGTLCGRGWGKTVGNVAHLVEGVLDGSIRRINLIGASDDEAYVVGVEDPYAGLLAWSPPWCFPSYSRGLLTWPNGAQCRIMGAYKPSRIRGGGVDRLWCTELSTWHPGTSIEAWDLAIIKTREGGAKILWDSTSEARNALLIDRARESLADPERYVIVTGDTRENQWLSPEYIADLLMRFAEHDESGAIVLDEHGMPKLTRRGEEELAAALRLDVSGALWQADWIQHRVAAPLRRRVISIDPAFSSERGSDKVGVCDAGVDVYDQFVVLDDRTALMRWEEWGDLAIEMYLAGRCDCIVVERNKAGDAVAANLRARALAREIRAHASLRVVALERGAHPPPHDPRTIYVREITARDSKWNRAEPVAGLYQAGLAYHVRAFADLEKTMTTWEPGPGVRSPNNLDAMTQACNELIDLEGTRPRADAGAIAAVARLTRALGQPARGIGAVVGGGRGGTL